ncbi:hypothetical protein [Streptomyces canus]|uniref:hypothetical protein n=1 Tax=Streptomyces canus TaxID=58343 RepID=UPI000749FA10|nr:hypothetical protein [Streptomyces canus]KUN02257.1 hypothetical protein AQI96_39965 [Streptomyces canus]
MAGHPGHLEAPRAALAGTRLRTNLRRATGTIRDRRLALVAKLDGWEDLRETAVAVKQRA